MCTINDIIRDSERISIISNDCDPTPIPKSWRPLLDACDVLVAIPDMHMYHYSSPLDGFRCGAEAMLSFLQHLERIRRSYPDRRLRILQLGDLYELWFSHPHNGRQMIPRDIWTSHPLYQEIHRLFRLLRVERICGNHDYRYITENDVRLAVRDGGVHLEHGFAADRWYHFSNPRRPIWRTAMAALKTLRRVESNFRGAPAISDDIPLLRSRAWGVGSGEMELDGFTRQDDYRQRSLLHYTHVLRDQQNEGHPVRLLLVGHTHKPYIDANFADGRGLYLDAGAWSYGRSDFAVVTNDEVAVCHYARSADVGAVLQYRQAV